MREKPLSYEEFVAIYSKVPRLCVDLVVRTDEGVLMTLRAENGYEDSGIYPEERFITERS